MDPVFYTAKKRRPTRGRYVTDVITDRAHRLPGEATAEQAVLPDDASQGAASALGSGRGARRALHGPVDPGAGNVLGLVRHADGRAARKSTARRGGPHATRPEAAATRRSRGPSSRRGSSTKPETVTTTVDGKTVTLTGEALVAGSISATCRTTSRRSSRSTTASAGCSTSLDRAGPREEHDRHLHERPGFLPRRSRPVRQALHVRRIAPDAVPGSLAGGDQGRAPGSDAHGVERRFRADVPGRRGPADPGRHAGPQPAADPPRPHAAPTGARRCTTATTTIPATTTRARTTASGRVRTS